MSTKLALIVDDSRSARHILARMLESFGLEVAAVESAELALTYLQTARPDVIFMDHLMPGMDGFAAVRVLKANPDTVTIPVLMYTSQEGDMYLSQARALGAMGVLPKTLKHADVAAALQHLNLLTPPAAQEAQRPAVASTPAAAPAMPIQEAAPEPLTVQASHIPQLAHRIAAEVRDELLQLSVQFNRRLNLWRAFAGIAAALSVVLLAVLLVQQNQTRQQLVEVQATQQQLRALFNTQSASTAAVMAAASSATPSGAPPLQEADSLPVAYGEVPLAGVRLEHLRTLVENLRSEARKATIRVATYAADFCLSSSGGAYEPAADEALQTSCALVGNPFGDALTVQQRQSVAFANLVSSVNVGGSDIKVQLLEGGRQTLLPYPARTATLTAGEWNRIAERNQRVEFTVQAQ